MRRLTFIFLLVLGFTIPVVAIEPRLDLNNKNMPNGPSLPIGGKDITTDRLRALSCEDSTGEDVLLVTTSSSSSVQICDTLGNCVDISTLGATIATTLYGLLSKSVMYFYDITTTVWDRWEGDVLQDNVDNASVMPRVNVYPMFFDGTADWYRFRGLQAADNLAADTWGLVTVDQMHFFDGTNFRRWLGGVQSSATILATPYSPFIQNLNFAWDVDNSNWHRSTNEIADGTDIAATVFPSHVFGLNYVWDGGDWKVLGADANGDLTVNQTTTNPGYWRLQDADSTGLAEVETAAADGIVNTKLGLWSNSRLYLYNSGTTNWDRSQISASGGLVATVDNWPSSYDEPNSWNNVRKSETGTLSPAKQSTATIGAAAVTALDSREVLSDPNFCVYVKNTDGADPFTDVDIEFSPNETDWVDGGWNACDALGAGVTCFWCVSNQAHRYMRVRITAAVAPNEASSDVWYTSNEN